LRVTLRLEASLFTCSGFLWTYFIPYICFG
jgi:hypothetical protein